MHLHKKDFTWQLRRYETKGLSLKIIFKHPEYISAFGVDTFKVIFKNAELFLSPQSETMKSTPDDYTVTVSIPPQAMDALTKEEMQDLQLKEKVVMIPLLVFSMVAF